MIEQITKHLNRLIEVVKVVDLTEGSFTERELMLVKVRAVGKEREEMKRMADIFRGRIIDVTEKTYTIELTGDSQQARCLPGRDRPRRDPGNRAHRRQRHRPRRTHPEGLTWSGRTAKRAVGAPPDRRLADPESRFRSGHLTHNTSL